jgi:uncharacterized MnhB-related membrane protein
LEAWAEARFPPYRFGVVFVLLIVTYVVMAASPPERAVRVTAVVLEGLLGFLFAFLYAAIDANGSAPFFVQTDAPTIQTFLYYSFVTQTTVGYGDYTAAASLGRTLSTTQALLGQIYLVTVIAVVVSRMTTVREPDGADGPVPEEEARADR